MLYVAICDDNPADQENIQKLVCDYFKPQKLAFQIDAFTAPDTFLKSEIPYDIVFLDMDLGNGADGITVGKKLRLHNQMAAVFITTNYTEYMQRGYEIDATRYLMKPIGREVFDAAMAPAMDRIAANNHRFNVFSNYQETCVYTNKIMYIESIKRERVIVTTEEVIRTRATLDTLYAMIGMPYIVRPQKYFLINLYYVSRYTAQRITMKDGTGINVARNKIEDMKAIMAKWMAGRIL